MKKLPLPGAAVVFATSYAPLAAQPVPWSPLERGSDNMQVLGHLPLGPRLSVADIELEQEMHRPYAYVARMQYGPVGPKGDGFQGWNGEHWGMPNISSAQNWGEPVVRRPLSQE